MSAADVALALAFVSTCVRGSVWRFIQRRGAAARGAQRHQLEEAQPLRAAVAAAAAAAPARADHCGADGVIVGAAWVHACVAAGALLPVDELLL